MDPNAAHIIGFALEVSLEEVDYLIQVARAQQSLASVERLREYREALAAIRAEFSATSENLQELADKTDAIASDLAHIEELLEVGENEQGFHCALAAMRLSGEAKFARGDIA